MDRLIYTALSGASQTLYEQQISANNLANVNTNGFRADMAMATNDKVKGGGFDTRYMAQEGASGVNDSTGVAEKTERPLDVAIQGAGYIAVQDKNGNEVYTRNGNIQQDDQGQLTIDGNLVLGDNGPIILPPNAIASFGSDGTLSVTPDDGDVTATMDIDRLKLVDIPVANLAKNPEGMLITADGVLTNSQGLPLQPEIDVPAGATNVAFGEDGTVTAILPGDSDVTELGQLTLVNFANPAGLSAEGDNLYLETAASGQPTEGVPGEDGLGTLQDNALEGSNVDIVNEMVAMITVQRAYEMNAKMVSAADDMLQYISQTL